MNEITVKPLKRAVIKEEYIAICGDMTEAVILNQMIYWSRRVGDYDKLLEEEKRRRSQEASETADMPFLHGWIHKSAAELKDEIMSNDSPKTVLRKLDSLVKKGFLDRRNNPDHPYDRIYQYRVNFNAVVTALDKYGYSLEGFKVDSNPHKAEDNADAEHPENSGKGHSVICKGQNEISNGQNDHWKGHHDNCNGHGVAAIPEITTENTTEIISSLSYSPAGKPESVNPKSDDEDAKGEVSELLGKIGIDKIQHKDMVKPISGIIADLMHTGKAGQTKYSRTQIKSTLGHLCAGDIDTVIDRYTAKAASGEIRNADSFIKACLLSAGKSEQLLKLSKKSDTGAIDRGNPSFDVDEFVRLSMERLHRE